MATVNLNLDLSSTLDRKDLSDIIILLKSYKSALEIGALGEESPIMVERIDELVEKINSIKPITEEKEAK